MSREEAREKGLKTYFPGVGCYTQGHVAPRYTSNGRCVRCMENRRFKRRNKAALLFKWAGERARKRGIKFTIQISDIKIPDVCPCCNVKLTADPTHTRMIDGIPSLDRLKPELGYIPENIAVICTRCNTLKSGMTLEQIEQTPGSEGIARWLRSLENPSKLYEPEVVDAVPTRNNILSSAYLWVMTLKDRVIR